MSILEKTPNVTKLYLGAFSYVVIEIYMQVVVVVTCSLMHQDLQYLLIIHFDNTTFLQ